VLLLEPHRRVQLRGRVLAPWWRRRFASFGDGSILHRPQWLVGAHKVAIGDRVLIFQGAWIAAEKDSWASEGPAITIGDDVAINRGVMISAAQRIVIGDGVLMAAGVTIIDCDHTMDGPHLNPAYNPLVSAPIHIGRGTWLGQNATVLRGSTIGERCVVAAGAIVRGDIPDGSIAAGVPARVVGQVGGR
jgi:acetyltransferase-like isoleucine patch superfamily enzyme